MKTRWGFEKEMEYLSLLHGEITSSKQHKRFLNLRRQRTSALSARERS
jgi:hypothetical protein